jgi:hypothetical protein
VGKVEPVVSPFHHQKALEDDDLLRYAGELGLDVAAFDRERAGPRVLNRTAPPRR